MEAEEEEEVVEAPLPRRKLLQKKKKLRRLPQLLICSAVSTHQLLFSSLVKIATCVPHELTIFLIIFFLLQVMTVETIKQYESKIKEYVNAYNLVSMRDLLCWKSNFKQIVPLISKCSYNTNEI